MRAALPETKGMIDRDGIKVSYAVYGNGSRTMLFLPPWPIVHSRVYKAQVPYFSDRFRVITFDPRGNGYSDSPTTPDGYAAHQFVDDAIAVLDATHTDKAVLFGLSLGGLYSALLAAYYSERVSALIACGAVMPLVSPHDYKNLQAVDAVRQTYEGWQKFNRTYWLTHFSDFSEFFISRMFCEKHSTKQIEDGCRWAAAGSGKALALMSMADNRRKYPVSEETYRRIACPSLWIHGAADEVTPAAMSEKAADLTGGELHIWPGVGHAANVRYPARVNLLARDFLARHLGTWRPTEPVHRAANAGAVS